MTDYEKPTSMTIGDYCWRLGHDGRYIMQDGYAGDRYQCGVTESLLVERLAKAEQKARWIPVSERLPEKGQTVIAYFPPQPDCPDSTVGEADYTGDSWSTQHGGWFVVTHWMPLPEPPDCSM